MVQEKTLYILGIEPGSHCLRVGSFTTLPNVAYTCLLSFNCIYGYSNLCLSLLQETPQITGKLEGVRQPEKPCTCWESNLGLTV